MHHIYHTEGVILGSRNFGEAGKHFYIFTRDHGMIFASAQGVRKLSSKLRFVLQDYAYIKVDLVRGKDFWRVTSAGKTGELENLPKRKGTLVVLDNVSRLLRRLLTGEEKNEDLFRDLIAGLRVLEGTNTKEDVRNAEVLLVLRMLYCLGYVGGGDAVEDCVTSPFESELIFQVSKKRAKILAYINKALRETQL